MILGNRALNAQALANTGEPPKGGTVAFGKAKWIGITGLSYAEWFQRSRERAIRPVLFVVLSSNTRLRGKPAKRVCPS
jgi:hypothetical protein